jgi:hypothetical protein
VEFIATNETFFLNFFYLPLALAFSAAKHVDHAFHVASRFIKRPRALVTGDFHVLGVFTEMIERGIIGSILLTLLETDEEDAWIGVDLDGCLARYDKWRGPTKIGEPIPAMVNRIRRWVGHGKKVKIFTARADDEKSVNAIHKWLKDHDLPDLEVTNLKDEHMVEMWDDRAVAVAKNTGEVKEDLLHQTDQAPYAFADDPDAELDQAVRQPFTAHEYATRYNRHHPRLWKAVKGSPFERDYRRRFNPTEAIVRHVLEDHDARHEWRPGWQPPESDLIWFVQHLQDMIMTGARKWEVPATGQVYFFDFDNRKATLIKGDPNDPEHYHQMVKTTLEWLGFTVREGTEEIAVAEAGQRSPISRQRNKYASFGFDGVFHSTAGAFLSSDWE